MCKQITLPFLKMKLTTKYLLRNDEYIHLTVCKQMTDVKLNSEYLIAILKDI